MPNYYINVRTESHISATVSIEKEGHTELRIEVATFVGDLLKDHAEQLWVDEDWQVDVSDEAGLILYVLHVSALKTSATALERSRPVN